MAALEPVVMPSMLNIEFKYFRELLRIRFWGQCAKWKGSG